MKRDAIAIFLCAKTPNMAAPWAEAGYECYCVDVQHEIRRERITGNIHFVWGDVRSWIPPPRRPIAFVAGFPPCTDTAGSGARDFAAKGGAMLRDAVELFDACRKSAAWSGAPYLIEQPVGVMSNLPHIGKPDYYFDPCDYTGFELTDDYQKRTCLWTGNGFVMPTPKRFVHHEEILVLGSPAPNAPDANRILGLSPSKDRADVRSATPLGFARAVFHANNPDAQAALWQTGT
jgi:hypothetical protein